MKDESDSSLDDVMKSIGVYLLFQKGLMEDIELDDLIMLQVLLETLVKKKYQAVLH